jgi:hypothetical protein
MATMIVFSSGLLLVPREPCRQGVSARPGNGLTGIVGQAVGVEPAGGWGGAGFCASLPSSFAVLSGVDR